MATQIGRVLIFLGCASIILGAVFLLIGRLPWLGKLPGDFQVSRQNFSFYFPLATCLLISLVLTLIFNLFKFFK
ncbi:MAG: DUF2905 domain-containing protein [Elusimicrobia bacterium]|nr:DUF2905 domain-containing protein [Elusimicrobiota bacterium]